MEGRTKEKGNGLLNQGIFVGLSNLREDPVIQKLTITLFQLRYLVSQCLELSPFMDQIELLLVNHYQKAYKLMKMGRSNKT